MRKIYGKKTMKMIKHTRSIRKHEISWKIKRNRQLLRKDELKREKSTKTNRIKDNGSVCYIFLVLNLFHHCCCSCSCCNSTVGLVRVITAIHVILLIFLPLFIYHTFFHCFSYSCSFSLTSYRFIVSLFYPLFS